MKPRVLLTISLLLLLSACNYLGGEEGVFRDRGSDYTEAPDLPPMQIPLELDSYTIDSLYVIPQRLLAETDVYTDEIPMPKPIESRRREGVIIQNLGDRRWILIDATPAQVWPLVRDYWTSLGVSLAYENPGAGIMETAWLEVDSDETTRHKYRVSIEPGLHSGYSEIYVRHLEQLRSEPEPLVLNWPEESSSLEREQQLSRTISQYLADRNDVYQASTASLLAGSIETERKANIRETSEGRVLELKIDYARAWVQVRSALEEADIEITDSDRDQNFINVRFAGANPEVDQPGFIGRIFRGGGDEGQAQPRDFAVRLVQTGTAINVVTEPMEVSEEAALLNLELLQVINEFIG